MSNKYGIDVEYFADKPSECVELLSRYLNKGHLGLLLGSGASSGIGLPGWKELVLSISNDIIPDSITPGKTEYSGHELKDLAQAFKRKINDQTQYYQIVKEHLYKGVSFDFSLARKELLIALSALIVGKRRGNVQEIFTYNFDSVLEWYLQILGLDVNTIIDKQSLAKVSDVNITHIHGYLPNPGLKVEDSDFLVFSQREFIDRQLSAEDYWKNSFYDFFRKYTFLAIGLSVDSLINDVCPYLTQMDTWYERNKINRLYPYGIAFLSPNTMNKELFPELLKHGIIPCTFPTHDDVPLNIFAILQKAASLS
jgi:hypothetical protein